MADDLAAALPGLQDAALSNNVLDLGRAWDEVQVALSEITDQGLVVEELLGSRGQLLTVLHSSIVKHGKVQAKVREAILKDLATQVAASEAPQVGTYTTALITSCLRALRVEDNVGPRAQWLDILTTLLRWQISGDLSGSADPAQRSPLDIAHTLQELYLTERSMRPTLKTAFLGAMGLLLQLTGQGDQRFTVAWLAAECRQLLDGSKANKSSQEVEGALRGLTAVLLLQQPGEDPATEQELFQWSMDLVDTAVARLKQKAGPMQYGPFRAALGCLASCAPHFAGRLMGPTQHILQQLMFLRTESSNRSMRVAAEEALTSVFDQVSTQLLAEAGRTLQPRQLQASLEALLAHLGPVLVSGAPRHSRAVVAGLERLMPAVARLLGQQGLLKVQGQLVPLVLRWSGPLRAPSTVDEYAEGRLDNEVSLLRCLASLLTFLEPGALEVCLQQSLAVADRIIGSYLELWPKQQDAVHAALLLLLRAAAQQGPGVLPRVVQHVSGVLLAHTLRPMSAQQPSIGPMAATAAGTEAFEPWQHYRYVWSALLTPDADTLQQLSSKAAGNRASGGRRHSSGIAQRAAATTGGTPPPAAAATAAAQDALVAQAGEALYKALISCSLDALQQLNLSYRLQEAGEPDSKAAAEVPAAPVAAAAETGAGLVADAPGDMVAFGHLSAFLCALLLECGPQRFAPWAYSFSSVVVAGSSRLPSLAGFYNLATTCIKLCTEAHLLEQPRQQDPAGVDSSSGSGSIGVLSPSLQQQVQQAAQLFCRETFQDYSKSVLANCRRFKDELLAAALAYLLAVPASVLPAAQLVQPVRLALQIGLQNVDVARMVVEALERWEQLQPQHMARIVPQILPYLEPYLGDATALAADTAAEAAFDTPHADDEAAAAASAADDKAAAGVAEAQQEGAAEALRRAGRDPSSFGRQQRSAAAEARQGQLSRQQGLLALQPRLQLWLGRQGAAAQQLLAPGCSKAASDTSNGGEKPFSAASPGNGQQRRWDPSPRVGVPLVFPQLPEAIPVFLDPILPPLAAAAESSPARSVRVAACEALHAITLWMVGTNARRPLKAAAGGGDESGGLDVTVEPTEFHAVYRHLFPVLLRCAASSEPVAKQLFEPLLFSLVHWFTRSASREGAEAMVLLDALMEALCQATSGALRELAGKLVGEWLKWSHKQKVSSSKGVNYNAVSLLRRLFDRLTRRQSAERLGAAVGLMFCARCMPEDLWEDYLLEALHHCCHALTLGPDTPGEGATVTQLRATLSSLVSHCPSKCLKALVDNSQLQQQASGQQQPQEGTAPAAFSSLASFLSWLWPLTALNHPAARLTAQQLHQCLSAELLTVLEDRAAHATSLGAPGAIPVAAAVSNAGPSAIWLQCGRSTSEHEQEVQQQLQLPAPSASIAAIATAVGGGEVGVTAGAAELVAVRADMQKWLPGLAAGLDWSRWALEQRMFQASDLQWLSSRCPMGTSPLEQLQLFLQLLPDPIHQQPPADATPTTSQPSVARTGGRGWTQCTGVFTGCDAQVQAVSLAAAKLLAHLAEAPTALQWAAGRLPAGAAPVDRQSGRKKPGGGSAADRVSSASAEGLVTRLALLGLLTPGQLGLAPSEGAARQQLSSLLLAYLSTSAACAAGGSLLMQLQQALEGFLPAVLLPALRQSGEAVPQLLAATPVLAGLTALLSQVSSPTMTSLVSPQLRKELASSCLTFVKNLPLSVATPQALATADGALQLALQLGVPHHDLLQQLLGSPAGAELYQAFKGTLHGWLLFNGPQLVPSLLLALAERAMQQQQVQASAGLESTGPEAAAGGSSGASAAAAGSSSGGQGGSGPQPGLVAELLLLGVCQGLVHSQAASGRQDLRTRGWVVALLAGLPTLAPMVSPDASTESYTLFLDLLCLLLALDARAVLQPNQSHHAFVLQSYITLLTLPKPQNAAVRTGAVQMLGSFLVQVSPDDLVRLVPALEQVVQDFGVDMPTDRSSTAALQYRQRLVALLRATASASAAGAVEACTLMLDILLPEVQKMGRCLEPAAHVAGAAGGVDVVLEGGQDDSSSSSSSSRGSDLQMPPQHIFQSDLEAGMYLIAAAAWAGTSASQTAATGASAAPPWGPAAPAAAPAAVEGHAGLQGAQQERAVAEGLLEWCRSLVLEKTSSYQIALVMGVAAQVMVPLLQAAPPAQRSAWYAARLPQLLAAADTGLAPGVTGHGDGAEQQQLLVKWIGYRLLRLMYELLTTAELDPVLATLPGRNQAIIKPAARDRKEVVAAVPGNQAAARLVRCEAWSTMATLLRATQSNPDLFKRAMFARHEHAMVSDDVLDLFLLSWSAVCARDTPSDLWLGLLDPALATTFPVLAPSGDGRERLMQAAAAVQGVKEQLRAHRAGAGGGGGLAFTQFGSMATPFATGTFSDFTLGSATASLDPAVSDLTPKVSASQFKLSSDSQEAGASLGQGDLSSDPFATSADKKHGGSDTAAAAAGHPGAAPPAAVGGQPPLGTGAMALSDKEEEQVLQLRSSLEQLVTCDDAYDAHPCMLPLVLFLEKAQQLPAGASGGGGMPAWLRLLLTALRDENTLLSSRLFLAKAVLHVEARHQQQVAAWESQQAALQEQQQQQAGMQPDVQSVDEAEEGANVQPKPTLFSQHAEELFPALVSVLVPGEGTITKNYVQEGRFNYVLRDLVLVVLRWDALFAGQQGGTGLRLGSDVTTAAEKLLRYLVLVGFSSEREVRRANSEYIKVLLSRWGPRVPLTGKELRSHLLGTGPKAAKTQGASGGTGSALDGRSESTQHLQYGLEMLALALWAKQGAALLQEGKVSEDLWGVVRGLLLQPDMRKRSANLLGSLAGLLLKELNRLQQQQQQGDGEGAAPGAGGEPPAAKRQRADIKKVSFAAVADAVEDCQRSLMSSRNWSGLLAFAAAAKVHYPQLVGRSLRAWLLSALGAAETEHKPDLLTTALQLLQEGSAQSSADLLVDIQNLRHRTWAYSSSTTIRRSVVHSASLQLLGTLLPQQPHSQAAALLLRLAAQYMPHPSAKCRGQFLEMLINTWQRFAADGFAAAATAQGADPQQQQMQQLEEALFFFLADKDGGVYQAVCRFWQDVLPKRLDAQLQALLGRLCACTSSSLLAASSPPDVTGTPPLPTTCLAALERAWPKAAAALLLHLVQADPGYSSRRFFQEPLAECEYEDLHVMTAAGGGATFASTQLYGTAQGSSNTYGATQRSTASQQGLGAGYVLATPTAGATFAPSNVLTVPLSLAAEPGGGGGMAAGASQAGDLLGNSSTASLQRRTNIKSSRYTTAGGRPYAAYAMLRRRAAAQHSMAERAKKVKLFRQYRTGELPDIQAVTPAALFAPISVLAAASAPVAGDLVAACAAAVQAGVEARQLPLQVLQDLRAAVQQAFASHPRQAPLVTALQQLARQDAGGWVAPGAAAAAAQAGGSVAAAVVQMEEQMLYSAGDTSHVTSGADTSTRSKRATTAAATAASSRHPVLPTLRTDGDAWQQLGRLYQQLGDAGDVLEVIRSRHLVKCPGSLAALSAEDAGQHQLAYNTFQELLDALEGSPGTSTSNQHLLGDTHPSDTEQDLWYAESLQCRLALGDWEYVEQQIEADVLDAAGAAARGQGSSSGLPVSALLKLLEAPSDRRQQLHADSDAPPSSSSQDPDEGADPQHDYTSYLLPYVRACLFGGGVSGRKLQALVTCAEQQKARLERLQAVAGPEVATWELAQGRTERCKAVLAASLQCQGLAWSTSADATAGRQTSLTVLQPLSEIQEVQQVLQGAPAAAAATGKQPSQQLEALVQKWLLRWPVGQTSGDTQISRHSAGLTGAAAAEAVWGTLGVRQLLLDVLMRQLSSDGTSLGLEVAAASNQLRLLAAQTLAVNGLPDAAAAVLGQFHQRQAVQRSTLVNTDGLLAKVVAVQLGITRLKDSSSSVGAVQQLTAAVQDIYPCIQDPSAACASGLPAPLVSGALSSLAEALVSIARHQDTSQHLEQGQALHQQQQGKRLSAALKHQQQALEVLCTTSVPVQQQQQEDLQQPVAWAPVAGTAAQLHLRFALFCSDLQQATAHQAGSNGLVLEGAWLTPPAQQLLDRADELVVQHLLQAMSYQSASGAEARLFLPAVLSALSQSHRPPSSSGPAGAGHKGAGAAGVVLSLGEQVFQDRWRDVPLAAFLPWVSQMLSRLAEPEGRVLAGPLEELANRYPQRVYAPFVLSSAYNTQAAAGNSSQLQQLLQPGNAALGDLPAFMQALHETTYPAQRWAVWCVQLMNLLKQGQGEAAAALYREKIWPDVIGDHLQQEQGVGAGATGPRRRPRTINQQTAKDNQGLFRAFFGDQGDKLRTMSASDLYRAHADEKRGVAGQLGADTGRLAGERQLSDLCTWFQHYTDTAATSHLDRPPLLLPMMPSPYTSSGGITGAGDLSEEQAVSIVGFGRMVSVFDSKQKPKRLRVYGSDFCTHEFVVKGGEDLRLDERIQQLWRLLAGLAGRHPPAAKRGLATALPTFDVVPLSPTLGLMAFVKDTQPLLTQQGRCLLPSKALAPADTAYHQLLQPRGVHAARFDGAWCPAAYSRPNQDMAKGFELVQETIPWDLLRRALQQGASDAAAWLQRRARYMSSVAAGSGWGWLAGVGDRHMGNLLLQDGTGAIVPIDFGYSFGSGVGLSVPELVPFRFTRQMQGVLQPHDPSAVLQPSLAAALEVCRLHQEVLAPVMAIFLVEPLSDWAKEPLAGLTGNEAAAAAAEAAGAPAAAAPPQAASRGAAGGQRGHRGRSGKSSGASSSAAESQAAIVAAVKMRAARQRLSGAHPIACLLEEAASHHRLKPFWPSLEALLTSLASDTAGPRQEPVPPGATAAPAEQGLWVEGRGSRVPATLPSAEVARLLLAMAASPQLLSRAWMGWRSFV